MIYPRTKNHANRFLRSMFSVVREYRKELGVSPSSFRSSWKSALTMFKTGVIDSSEDELAMELYQGLKDYMNV